MTIERQTVGERLAIRLHAAEMAVDVAIAETAALASMLPQARIEAHLSAVTGQRAFEGVADAVNALIHARGHLVHTHNTLAVLARRMGLPDLAAGPTDKPDQEPPFGVTSAEFVEIPSQD
ncbi:MAG: hypothetical protein EON91_03610 [Brevundimonas sp.]|uniref:hypothetical protein n=1 Tax=Brevundimonas sp. TaxID=1871086 RepID=UPI0012149E18|nr:hypothetical protein [Brevundimonas sp.]RZJ18857.1 MAG: hypothetical protein EON91_03610 [Brevundimonas sp.]